MKNAIIQYYLDYNGVGKQEHHYSNGGPPEWARYSVGAFKEYADRHGADHHFYQDRFVNAKSNFFECLRVYLDPSLDEYDKILYVDVDVMPKNMASNIFHVNVMDIAGVAEFPYTEYAVPVNWNRSGPLKSRFEHFGARLEPSTSTQAPFRMINSGVVLWSREARLKARELFIDHEEWFNYKNAWLDNSLKGVGHSSHCLDQPFLNAMWSRFEFDVLELGKVWNRFPTRDENSDCVFAHYVQDYRFKIPELFKDKVTPWNG